MLTICHDCRSKLFSTQAPHRACEACGSSRVAVVSSAGALGVFPLSPQIMRRAPKNEGGAVEADK